MVYSLKKMIKKTKQNENKKIKFFLGKIKFTISPQLAYIFRCFKIYNTPPNFHLFRKLNHKDMQEGFIKFEKIIRVCFKFIREIGRRREKKKSLFSRHFEKLDGAQRRNQIRFQAPLLLGSRHLQIRWALNPSKPSNGLIL